MNRIEINSDQLLSEIEDLALISEADPPVVTRVVFTDADMRARAWLKDLCEAVGLSVRRDAIGNTFARWQGSHLRAPVVGTGSHIDAIPNAGKFDGVVGVLGGLEALRALQRSGFRPKHSLELLLLTSEEPTRFGIGCLGSRLLAATMSPDEVCKLVDKDGESVDDVRRKAGLHGELEQVKLPAGYYKAFVELHIEQGPILEREKIPLGVVTRIAAPASGYATIEGAGGHAGGALMQGRRDALCAASELILAIENAARTSGSPDTVATVGMCDVFPGAINSIPSRVRISLDVRDTDLARRDRVMRALQIATQEISARRLVSIRVDVLNADAPAECAPAVVDALSAACKKAGVRFLPMVSRAYHDSLFLSRIAPVAMIFIPCRNGYSHRPDEYASIEDISRGTLVLAETLAALSS
jgi:N-carbamoyl-L-amino-acid hydrolase